MQYASLMMNMENNGEAGIEAGTAVESNVFTVGLCRGRV
jgi:hypothetical protein